MRAWEGQENRIGTPEMLESAESWASRNNASWKLTLKPWTNIAALPLGRAARPTRLSKAARESAVWRMTVKSSSGRALREYGHSISPGTWSGGIEITNSA